ncbi:hypothetical protein OTU49_006287 [Cherax quadricarinatus]|uniref:Papilin n=2 Tax=Cherax quadricarinatus TaxID=27406 RepID=A0AAW0YIC9_CHEQU
MSDNQCKSFVYSGCGGNYNNFGTLDVCMNYCGSKKDISSEEDFNQEFCFLEKHQGTCGNLQAYWHFDSQDGVCKQFLYGGCDGNENRFSSRQECEKKCGEAIDICQLPLVIGPCSGSFRQFYYDGSSDECYEFDYGGCQGNKNRFDSKHLCQQRCKRIAAVLSTTPHTYPEIDDTEVEDPEKVLLESCTQPVDAGHCRASIPSWYFDPEQGRCIGFSYGGCEGNANRFQSVELCERQCGRYRNQDVCNLPLNSGPCDGSFRKWYHDPYMRRCKPFVYSGCEGNGNRFSTEQECEAECIYHDTILPDGNNTQEANTMICEMDVDAGPCLDGYKRWHFSKEHGSCIAYVYGGCGGNRNRFKKFNTCTQFCSAAIHKYRKFVSSTTTDSWATSLEPSGLTHPVSDQCSDALLTCQLLQCPYGVQRSVDNEGCDRCSCYDPCDQVQCRNGTQCAIDIAAGDSSGETTYTAICRKVNKAGECPKTSGRTYQCETDCENDAGCYGDHKCCYNGCGYTCVAPVRADQEPAYSPLPVFTTVPPVTGQPPRIVQFDSEVSSEENDLAVLRCVAQGSPMPTITWYRGSYAVDTEGGVSRTKLLADGSLQIVNTEQNDAGHYTCEASNGVGRPATKTAHLKIIVPLRAIIRLNTTEFTPSSTIRIPCEVKGYPHPVTTWFKGEYPVEASEKYEIEEDRTLAIKDAQTGDSGRYKCQVQNEFGIADSTTVITVKGVYVHPSCTDNPFFANCKLIVRAQYCTNKYYARFCCRSCTLAGQLPFDGPHLLNYPSSSKRRK